MGDVDGGECRATRESSRAGSKEESHAVIGAWVRYGAWGEGRGRLHRALHPLQLDDAAKELLVTLFVRELLEAVAKVPCRGSGTAPVVGAPIPS